MAAPAPITDLSGLTLADIMQAADDLKLPPVDEWHPTICGHSEMRITADGTWLHQGDPIRRPALVRLFAHIIRREADGSYVLVTPVEKLVIEVDDLPFVAVEMKCEGEAQSRRIAFRLNTGDLVVAGPDHALTLQAGAGDPRPAVEVGNGLAARIARPVYYELAELALAENSSPPGLWSNGAFFRLDQTA